VPALLLSLVSCLVFYVLVRLAVKHGILDADDVRRDREHAARLREQLRGDAVPGPPAS
jgi:hypothetical protein